MSVFQVLIAVGITFVAVAIGIAAKRIAAAWLTFRSQFVVTCPEDRTPAGVIVDAMHAAVTAWRGRPDLRLSGCSHWPERGGCRQTCLAQIGTAPQDCQVRSILARWYDGKYCVRCGVPVGEAYWGASKPALLAAGEVEQCEQIPGPQLLPILETAQPVCFDCYVEARAKRNIATLAAH